MKNAILFSIAVLMMAGCAQRLRERPKSGETTISHTDEKLESELKAARQKAALESKKGQSQKAPADLPLPEANVKSPLKVSSCGVEFSVAPEKEAQGFMSQIAGLWLEGAPNTERNVVAASSSLNLNPTAIRLGEKNEDISLSKVTLNNSESGPKFEVAANDIVAKGVSYQVSPLINGFRLVEITMTSARTQEVSCSTFAFKLSPKTEASNEILSVIGPVQGGKVSIEEFFAANTGKEKPFHRN